MKVDGREINCTNLEERKRYLENIDVKSLNETKVQTFVDEVGHWYPVYEHYGERLYASNSLLYKVSHCFDTYTKIGKDAALSDINKFKEFLQEDIKEEIQNLANRILRIQNQ